MNAKALGAEFIGTFALVSAVCGTALFLSPEAGGSLGYALAVGLTVLAMCYAVGHLSGGHFNPAVTLGFVAGGRFDSGTAVGYIVAQVLGGIAAALCFYSILGGAPSGQGGVRWSDFAAMSNAFGPPRGFQLMSAFLIEAVLTALLVIVYIGSTSKKAPVGFAPIAVGVALVAFHLMATPITNTSLNPARSTATAVLAGGNALSSALGVLGGADPRRHHRRTDRQMVARGLRRRALPG